MNNDKYNSTDFSNEVINTALDLSMEFGENWLLPINKRLLDKYPHLTVRELNKYVAICKNVNKIGNKYIYDNPVYTNEKAVFPNFQQFENYMLQLFDWINNENLKRLYSQSCYYIRK